MAPVWMGSKNCRIVWQDLVSKIAQMKLIRDGFLKHSGSVSARRILESRMDFFCYTGAAYDRSAFQNEDLFA
jgi:hypothetical protein